MAGDDVTGHRGRGSQQFREKARDTLSREDVLALCDMLDESRAREEAWWNLLADLRTSIRRRVPADAAVLVALQSFETLSEAFLREESGHKKGP